MPADDPSPAAPAGRVVGFATYSDDTPRDHEIEAEPQTWALRRPPPQVDMPPPPEAVGVRRSMWAGIAAAGVLIVAGAGGVALLRLANFGVAPTGDDQESAVVPRVQVIRAAQQPAPPIPPPAANTPPANLLPANLSPDVQALDAPKVALRPSAGLPAAPAEPSARTVPRLAVTQPAPLPLPAAPEPRAEAGACGNLRSVAQQVVCGDPQLSAADRRMARAYALALSSGAPEEDLRADQDDWLRIREDAARYSRRALMNVYRQRIDELEAIVRDPSD